jgi:hypothetical protein
VLAELAGEAGGRQGGPAAGSGQPRRKRRPHSVAGLEAKGLTADGGPKDGMGQAAGARDVGLAGGAGGQSVVADAMERGLGHCRASFTGNDAGPALGSSLRDQGREYLGHLLELQPGLTVAAFIAYAARVVSPELTATYVDGFRKVGLPEE